MAHQVESYTTRRSRGANKQELIRILEPISRELVSTYVCQESEVLSSTITTEYINPANKNRRKEPRTLQQLTSMYELIGAEVYCPRHDEDVELTGLGQWQCSAGANSHSVLVWGGYTGGELVIIAFAPPGAKWASEPEQVIDLNANWNDDPTSRVIVAVPLSQHEIDRARREWAELVRQHGSVEEANKHLYEESHVRPS